MGLSRIGLYVYILYSIYYMYIVCRIEGSGGQTIKSIMNRDNNLLILFYVCINVWFLSWMLTNVCKKCFAKVINISNKTFVGMAPHCVSWSSIYIWIWCRPSASLLHQCDIKAPQLVRHKEVKKVFGELRILERFCLWKTGQLWGTERLS